MSGVAGKEKVLDKRERVALAQPTHEQQRVKTPSRHCVSYITCWHQQVASGVNWLEVGFHLTKP
jgi:hypothetical protein